MIPLGDVARPIRGYNICRYEDASQHKTTPPLTERAHRFTPALPG